MKEKNKVFSAELKGIQAELVEVEADFNAGLHSFNIVGLADKAISEAKERVNSALKNSGFKPPLRENRKITINLAPADIKKTGAHFDLPIAISYLLASGQIKNFITDDKVFAGELSLDGKLRSISGALNIAVLVKRKGFKEIYLPAVNAKEANIIKGVKIFGVNNLTELIGHLEGNNLLFPEKELEIIPSGELSLTKIGDIKGQGVAKRALVVAAAGGHNILLSGPPGTGKTMLAEAMVSLLPQPSYEEIVEMTEIWSAAGLLNNENAGFINFRPFRAPHHSASLVSLIGGGSDPKPGEISLAHRGILFLDEFPEYKKDVIEALRQPLEKGNISLARAKKSVIFPARFLLVAAKNPCPCGHFGDKEKECICLPGDILRYNKKISGPLLDRIDIQINVNRIKAEELVNKKGTDSKEEDKIFKEMVCRARERQKERFEKAGLDIYVNSEMSVKDVESLIKIKKEALEFAKKVVEKNFISGRGYFRTLKVAQTIADLENALEINIAHLAEAFQYRVRDFSV